MPAKSKAQQRFMGMVHAAQKGDKAASAKVAKVAKRMKKKDAEDYASTKHTGKPEKVKTEYKKFRGKMTYGSSKPKKGDYVKIITGQVGQVNKVKGKIAWVKLASDSKSFWPSDVRHLKPTGKKEKGKTLWTEDRDYKDEYKKFQSSTKAKKYRAELNQYNRKKGTYGNNDGKDASHKGGKIAGFEKESTNRGRAEKSRLKKEEVSINVDKLLKNSKIKALMKRLHIKKSQSQDAALKILNYFANNPHALAAIKKVAFESINEGPWPVKGKIGGVSQEAKLLEKAFKSAGVKVYKVKEYGTRGSNYFVDVQAKGGKTTISIEVNQVSNVVFMHGQGRDVKIGELKENPRELIKVLKMLKKQPGFGQSKLAKKESISESKQAAMYVQTFDKLLKKQTKGKLPTVKDIERVLGLMKKRLKEDWWSEKSTYDQAQYIKDHPNSDKAKSSKKARKGTDANRKKLSKRGYGIDSATGKAVKKSKKKEDPKKQNKHRKAVSKGIFPGSPEYSRFMRESVNEGKWSKIMKSVRKGSKAGPWTIVVYKGKKVLHQRRVKMLQQIPAHYEDVLNLKDLAPGIKIGIEDKFGERVYTESINEGFTKYHIRLTKTPGWYGVWDENGKQKFEGDRKFVTKHLKKLKTRMGNVQLKSLIDVATKRKGKDISFDVVESVNEGFDKYHLGGLGDSKLKNRLERAIKIWGGKVDAVGMDTIKFRLSSSDVMKFPALLKKLDRNKNVWIGDKRKNNVYDRKQNINKLGEAISKEDWAQYPKYARKLKPYMQRLLKVPLKVRVIKHAFANPWIEIRVAKFGKDVIPNDFRLKAAKAIGATSIRDKSNVNYGNIRSNSVSLKHDQWVKLLGNKVKSESVNEGFNSSQIKKAIGVAKKMSGNMTGATKKIEKIKKGLSNDKKVKDALRLVNESVNEAKFTDDTLVSRLKHWSKQHKGTGIGYGHVLGHLAVHMKEMGWEKSYKEVARIAVELGKKKKVESVDESGILYRAGVKKYGKEGMRKIQQAAGKRKSHAVIGKIKDKYEKNKKESVANKDCCDNCRQGKECCSNEE